jgi:hypothetical protein
VSFAALTLCVAAQRVFVVVDFVIDTIRKFWIHTRTGIPKKNSSFLQE